MRDSALRILLGAALLLGGWALLAPASFAQDLGLGQAWVATDGPYNEHLVRDVGGLYLALAVLTRTVARRRDPGLDRGLALAWLATAVPHLGYHATHLAPFAPLDAAAQVLSLTVLVVLPLLVLATARVSAEATT